MKQISTSKLKKMDDMAIELYDLTDDKAIRAEIRKLRYALTTIARLQAKARQ